MKSTGRPAELLVSVCALVILGLSGAAWARGDGIKAGEGRMHPSLDLDLAFDTNPGYFRDGDALKAYDMALRIRPGISLSFPSDAVSFELNGKVGYDRYFGVQYNNTSDLSSVVGEADLKLGFNPNGVFSFFIEDVFSRTGDPRYTSLAGKFNRTDNEAKAHFQIKPGGGALMFDLAYGFFIDWFDASSSYGSDALSSYAHRAYFSGKWKFLPKTAVTVDFDADIRRYPNEYTGSFIPSVNHNIDVNAIRATAGMLGQITPSLSVVVKAGYGDTLLPSVTGYTGGSDYRSAIGQVELTFQPGTTFIQLGYLRNFQPVVLFAYFGQDRVYARFKQQIAGKLTLAADVGFDILGYGRSIIASDATPRWDYLLSGSASVEYFVLDWLGLGLRYDILGLFSDYEQPDGSPGGVGYNKHMFTFHVGIDY